MWSLRNATANLLIALSRVVEMMGAVYSTFVDKDAKQTSWQEQLRIGAENRV